MNYLKSRPGYDQSEVDTVFSKQPKILYHYEPFDFFGGSFNASDADRQMMMKDQIYRKQEAEIVQQRQHIEMLKQQADELTWLNSLNEQNYAKLDEKYKAKKQKIKDERLKYKRIIEEMEQGYED